jgi:hypothetical protein
MCRAVDKLLQNEGKILVLGLKCFKKGIFHVLSGQQIRGKSQVYKVRMRSQNNTGI